MPGPHRWAIGCDRPMAHQVPIPNTSAAKLSRVPHLTRLRVLVAALAHELNRQREKEHRPKATCRPLAVPAACPSAREVSTTLRLVEVTAMTLRAAM